MRFKYVSSSKITSLEQKTNNSESFLLLLKNLLKCTYAVLALCQRYVKYKMVFISKNQKMQTKSCLCHVMAGLYIISSIIPDKFFTMSTLPTRGNSLKIFKRCSRMKMRASVFSNRIIDVWNSLPKNVVIASSLNSFKSMLNKHWHGHELKVLAKCYTLCETAALSIQRTYPNGSLEVA